MATALTEEPFQERFLELRTRLQGLRYHQPIDLASAPLVESLLDDLCSANDQLIEVRQQSESQAQELIVAQNAVRRRAPCSSQPPLPALTPHRTRLARTQVHPLRKENGRLLRETNQLHLELITKAEEATKAHKELAEANTRIEKQNTDLRFVVSQQTARLKSLEEQNIGLRERFDAALQENGAVLPSGHEVRWHGRKEHMEAHSPVDAATGASPEGSPAGGDATTGDAAADKAAELLRLSEGQMTQLQKRLAAAEEAVEASKRGAAEARAQVAARDVEVARLGGLLETGRDFKALTLQHINASNQEAVAQLNHQVDFLNAQNAALEEELRGKQQAHALASQRQQEKEALLKTVARLEDDKAAVRAELQSVKTTLERLQAAEVVRAVTGDVTAGGGGGGGGGGGAMALGPIATMGGMSSSTHNAAAASRARRAEEEVARARAEAAQAREERDEARKLLERAQAETAKVGEVYATYQREKKQLGAAVQLLHVRRRALC